MSSMSPHAGRFPSALLLCLLVDATVVFGAVVRPASAQTVDVHTDVIAVSANGDIIYALDETTGRISFANVPAELPVHQSPSTR
jgi:hypothetical protein